jgi:formaldehyde-activating enzyme involved in methanogenesis
MQESAVKRAARLWASREPLVLHVPEVHVACARKQNAVWSEEQGAWTAAVDNIACLRAFCRDGDDDVVAELARLVRKRAEQTLKQATAKRQAKKLPVVKQAQKACITAYFQKASD